MFFIKVLLLLPGLKASPIDVTLTKNPWHMIIMRQGSLQIMAKHLSQNMTLIGMPSLFLLSSMSITLTLYILEVRLTKHITNLKLDDSWRGTIMQFTMHFKEQLHLLDSLVTPEAKLPDTARLTFLQTSVESIP